MDKREKEHYLSIIFIVLTALLWGYSFISTKIILTELPPASIAFFRQIIASITLITWMLLTRSLKRMSVRHLPVLASSALFGIILYFLFENNGLRFTTAANASIIISALPVFTMITEAILYKSKVSLRTIFSITLSILGVILVITADGNFSLSSGAFWGNMLVLGAVASWVVYTMLNKKLSEEYSSVVITLYQSLAGIFLYIPFIISETGSWKNLTLYPFFNLIYLGVFCSALAYFFYIYASKRLGATTTTAFLNLNPVVSVIAGYFVLGERLYPLQIIGMFVIMLSLFILSRREKSPLPLESTAEAET